MHSSSFHFLPPFFGILALLFAVVIAVLQIGVIGYAYEKMGISRVVAYGILFASLIGGSINIPIADLPGGQAVEMREVVDNWGMRYSVPMVREWPGTVLAINVGGALIPTVLSCYFIFKNRIYFSSLLGVAAVAAVVHALAEPIQGMGISVPVFIPPIISAGVAMLLEREHAAPLAYVSGCLGTLVGADLLNLDELAHLGASIASIGGAGTFDGVFLTGILAVLLAGRPGFGRRTTPTVAATESADPPGVYR